LSVYPEDTLHVVTWSVGRKRWK